MENSLCRPHLLFFTRKSWPGFMNFSQGGFGSTSSYGSMGGRGYGSTDSLKVSSPSTNLSSIFGSIDGDIEGSGNRVRRISTTDLEIIPETALTPILSSSLSRVASLTDQEIVSHIDSNSSKVWSLLCFLSYLR